jgi:hypothetical protein
MEFRGKVVKGPLGAGSKSEHEATYLETDDGERYVLRRVGGNAFADPALVPLVGQHVTCVGKVVGYTLLADSIEPD